MNLVKDIDWDSIPGPESISRFELPNGVTLLTRPNFNSASIVVNGYMRGGSMFDPAEKLGLAHFTAQALMYGTQNRSFHEIYDLLEASGASFGFGAVVHNVSFSGRALAEDLHLLLDILSDCVRYPVFPDDQLKKIKSRMLAGLAIRNQDTSDLSSLHFDRLLFDGHPYGRPVDGHPETVQNINRKDLLDFYSHNYGPHGMVIVVVGPVAPEKVLESVEHYLGDWQENPLVSEFDFSLPDSLPKPIREHYALPGKLQTDLIMGGFGPKRISPDFIPLSIGNNILGQFGMMGRIGEVVREQAGLAYYASSSLNAWIESGSWEVSAGVSPKNLEQAIELIRQEMRRFIQEKVTESELSDSKANYIGSLPLSLESNSGVSNAMLRLERFQLGLDYYKRYPYLIAEVTADQILQSARTYLNPDHLVVVSSGPELV